VLVCVYVYVLVRGWCEFYCLQNDLQHVETDVKLCSLTAENHRWLDVGVETTGAQLNNDARHITEHNVPTTTSLPVMFLHSETYGCYIKILDMSCKNGTTCWHQCVCNNYWCLTSTCRDLLVLHLFHRLPQSHQEFANVWPNGIWLTTVEVMVQVFLPRKSQKT